MFNPHRGHGATKPTSNAQSAQLSTKSHPVFGRPSIPQIGIESSPADIHPPSSNSRPQIGLARSTSGSGSVFRRTEALYLRPPVRGDTARNSMNDTIRGGGSVPSSSTAQRIIRAAMGKGTIKGKEKEVSGSGEPGGSGDSAGSSPSAMGDSSRTGARRLNTPEVPLKKAGIAARLFHGRHGKKQLQASASAALVKTFSETEMANTAVASFNSTSSSLRGFPRPFAQVTPTPRPRGVSDDHAGDPSRGLHNPEDSLTASLTAPSIGDTQREYEVRREWAVSMQEILVVTGHYERLHNTLTGIERRILAETKLRSSEERYARLLEIRGIIRQAVELGERCTAAFAVAHGKHDEHFHDMYQKAIAMLRSKNDTLKLLSVVHRRIVIELRVDEQAPSESSGSVGGAQLGAVEGEVPASAHGLRQWGPARNSYIPQPDEDRRGNFQFLQDAMAGQVSDSVEEDSWDLQVMMANDRPRIAMSPNVPRRNTDGAHDGPELEQGRTIREDEAASITASLVFSDARRHQYSSWSPFREDPRRSTDSRQSGRSWSPELEAGRGCTDEGDMSMPGEWPPDSPQSFHRSPKGNDDSFHLREIDLSDMEALSLPPMLEGDATPGDLSAQSLEVRDDPIERASTLYAMSELPIDTSFPGDWLTTSGQRLWDPRDEIHLVAAKFGTISNTHSPSLVNPARLSRAEDQSSHTLATPTSAPRESFTPPRKRNLITVEKIGNGWEKGHRRHRDSRIDRGETTTTVSLAEAEAEVRHGVALVHSHMPDDCEPGPVVNSNSVEEKGATAGAVMIPEPARTREEGGDSLRRRFSRRASKMLGRVLKK